MVAAKGLGHGGIIFKVVGLRVDEFIVFHPFIVGGFPPFAVGEVTAPAFLTLVGFLLVYLGGVARIRPFGRDQPQGG